MTNKQVAQVWLATLVAIFFTAFCGTLMGIAIDGAMTLLSLISLGVQFWGISRLWKSEQ